MFYEEYTLGGSYGWRFSRPKVVEAGGVVVAGGHVGSCPVLLYWVG